MNSYMSEGSSSDVVPVADLPELGNDTLPAEDEEYISSLLERVELARASGRGAQSLEKVASHAYKNAKARVSLREFLNRSASELVEDPDMLLETITQGREVGLKEKELEEPEKILAEAMLQRLKDIVADGGNLGEIQAAVDTARMAGVSADELSFAQDILDEERAGEARSKLREAMQEESLDDLRFWYSNARELKLRILEEDIKKAGALVQLLDALRSFHLDPGRVDDWRRFVTKARQQKALAVERPPVRPERSQEMPKRQEEALERPLEVPETEQTLQDLSSFIVEEKRFHRLCLAIAEGRRVGLDEAGLARAATILAREELCEEMRQTSRETVETLRISLHHAKASCLPEKMVRKLEALLGMLEALLDVQIDELSSDEGKNAYLEEALLDVKVDELRSAIAEGKKAGLREAELVKAETNFCMVDDRRHCAARAELVEAMNEGVESCSSERLRDAIQKATSLGLTELVRKPRALLRLREAIFAVNLNELRSAIDQGRKADLDESALVTAEAREHQIKDAKRDLETALTNFREQEPDSTDALYSLIAKALSTHPPCLTEMELQSARSALKEVEEDLFEIGIYLAQGRSEVFIRLVEHFEENISNSAQASIQDVPKYSSQVLPNEPVQRKKMLVELYSDESDLYRRVNECLRNDDEKDMQLLSGYIRELRDVFRTDDPHQLLTCYQGTVYRGIKVPNSRRYLASLQVNTCLVWAAFTSTSRCAAVAEEFQKDPQLGIIFEIKCCLALNFGDFGDRVLYAPADISGLSLFANEDEVLFPPHVQFRIVNIKNNIVQLETVECPSVWDLIKKQDWVTFQKWADVNQDRMNAHGCKSSIITSVAKEFAKQVKPMSPEVPNPLDVCLEAKADINEIDAKAGQTPLLAAAAALAEADDSSPSENVATEALKWCLSHGADPSVKSKSGLGLLDYSSKASSLDPRFQISRENLERVVNSGDKIVEALSSAKASVDSRDTAGRAALHTAASENKVEAIKALIDARANTEARSADGSTPLILASYFGQGTSVEALLNLRASANAQDKDGITALGYALSEGHGDPKIPLIAAGADLQEAQASISNIPHAVGVQKRLGRHGGASGDVKISLMWNSYDDLDLYVLPPSGEKIYFSNRTSKCGGELDVDMNVRGTHNQPVENVQWAKGVAPKGKYEVNVNMYARHRSQVGKSIFYTLHIHVEGVVTVVEGYCTDQSRWVRAATFEKKTDPDPVRVAALAEARKAAPVPTQIHRGDTPRNSPRPAPQLPQGKSRRWWEERAEAEKVAAEREKAAAEKAAAEKAAAEKAAAEKAAAEKAAAEKAAAEQAAAEEKAAAEKAAAEQAAAEERAAAEKAAAEQAAAARAAAEKPMAAPCNSPPPSPPDAEPPPKKNKKGCCAVQ